MRVWRNVRGIKLKEVLEDKGFNGVRARVR